MRRASVVAVPLLLLGPSQLDAQPGVVNTGSLCVTGSLSACASVVVTLHDAASFGGPPGEYAIAVQVLNLSPLYAPNYVFALSLSWTPAAGDAVEGLDAIVSDGTIGWWWPDGQMDVLPGFCGFTPECGLSGIAFFSPIPRDPTTDLLSITIQTEGGNIVWTAPTPVPEPITIILMGTGLAGIGAIRARRRKKDELA